MKKQSNSPSSGSLSKAPHRWSLSTVVLVMLSTLLAATGGALFRVAYALRGLDMNLLLFYLQDSQIEKLGLGRYSVVQEVAKACVPYAAAAAILILVFWLCRLFMGRVLFTLRVRLGRRRFQWSFPKSRRSPRTLPVFLSVLLLCSGLGSTAWSVQLPQYLMIRSQGGSIYDEEYIDPRGKTITFPQGKRNLIHIVMESMETTYSDRAHGGQWETSLIPNLTALAEENISFSTMVDLSGANFTSGGLAAQTAGLPLIQYSSLPGAWTLGDILAEEGYRQVFMCGSDGDFGMRKQYFEQHQTEVWDYFTAQELGKIAPDYLVGWGMEDFVLYDNAKEVLTDLAQDSAPFSFTLLTVDTHFFDGMPCEYCEWVFPSTYEMVNHCADNLLYQFVQWIQEQDFYEDTTIVITGDHLSSDHGFFFQHGVEMADRQIYNCVINPVPGLKAPARDRTLAGVDIFPTTLRAMGAEWDGARLGLGVDLFSGEPTLVERIGQQALSVQVLADVEGAKKFYVG